MKRIEHIFSPFYFPDSISPNPSPSPLSENKQHISPPLSLFYSHDNILRVKKKKVPLASFRCVSIDRPCGLFALEEPMVISKKG